MIGFIDEHYRTNSTTGHRTHIYMYAHNAKKFDNWIVLQQKKYRFKSFVKSSAGLLKLSVFGEYVIINFLCTLSHFQSGSLDKLCDNYEVPQYKRKLNVNDLGFTHDMINEDNYVELSSKWIPYLVNDVISLGYIWTKYICSMHEISKKNDNCSALIINSCISSPSLSWKIHLNWNKKILTSSYKAFINPVIKKFI